MSSSTPTDGEGKVVADAIRETRQMLADAAAEQEQLEFFEPLTADDIEAARQVLGPGAGIVTVMREARSGKAGRKPGVRNRRTEDFVKYIGQFGQDPSITLMQIQATPTEELVARSKLIDDPKRQMSYADAASLRVRCAEALLPYIHSKQPVAVDANIRGVVVIEEVSKSSGLSARVVDMADDEPLGVMFAGELREGETRQ